MSTTATLDAPDLFAPEPQEAVPPTAVTLKAVQAAGEDFEWYPTTARMIEVVARHIPKDAGSIMDIGAGDGRVLMALAKRCEHPPELYGIEKSTVLVQAQPETITPVGTEFAEQNLACLPVDYIFSNPPYSQFELWATTIIESGHAKKAFLVIPERWEKMPRIQDALKRREAKTRVIHKDDFLDGERQARAVVHIVEITFPTDGSGWSQEKVLDPFDIWFEQNIHTFDQEETGEVTEYEQQQKDLAKIRHFETIGSMVEGFNEEHARMEANYRKIFTLDYALLKELGVSKENVREGIKKKMAGLKIKYWQLLFERLDTITNRLATETKKKFLERLTGRASVAFTASNAYAVALWAIKHANKYYSEQLIALFRELSTFEGVMNYKSNQKAWQKDGWRYNSELLSHYALDYRIVVHRWNAIHKGGYDGYQYPGGLSDRCHELIDDIIAVLYNLGFAGGDNLASRRRAWAGGEWQDWYAGDNEKVLFQIKGYLNGNVHLRFMPEAIKAMNVEVGRLLGWIRNKADVVNELGYTAEEAERYFGCSLQLTPGKVKLLTMAGGVEQ